MAEISRPWGGTVTGDAGPYSDDQWEAVWRSIARGAPIPTNLGGVLRDELNELVVTGATSPLSVDTGRAVAHGAWYENSAAVSVAVATPGGATRIDRIVLRKDWTAQTVRIFRIAGVEGGGAPALVQTDGVTWDTPLFQASITTGGAITLTDEREFIPANAYQLIRKTADETVNNSAVLQDDDDLFFAIGAYETWAATFYLALTSQLAADFKAAIVVPAGATLLVQIAAVVGASTGSGHAGTGWTTSSGTGLGVINNDISGTVQVTVYVINGATPGNVQLQWAQNSADASDTIMRANSYLIAHPV